MHNPEYLTAIATCFIAFATFVNVWVYWIISGQIERQIGLANDQIELTGNLFLESHAPALSVSLEECEYFEPEGLLEGQIVTTNHGAAAADNLNLRISFGGSSFIKTLTRISIQPLNRIAYTFSLPITPDKYKIAQTEGNRLNVLIEGSYRGRAGKEYKYAERQEYESELHRFVPFWAE
jgi:hypothetical protein